LEAVFFNLAVVEVELGIRTLREYLEEEMPLLRERRIQVAAVEAAEQD
jgi:hypothetical protein